MGIIFSVFFFGSAFLPVFLTVCNPLELEVAISAVHVIFWSLDLLFSMVLCDQGSFRVGLRLLRVGFEVGLGSRRESRKEQKSRTAKIQRSGAVDKKQRSRKVEKQRGREAKKQGNRNKQNVQNGKKTHVKNSPI